MRVVPFVVLSLLASACDGGPKASHGDPSAQAPSGLPDGDPALACREVEQGGVLLDVRSPGEFDSGHVKGAVNIPIDQLDQQMGRVSELTEGDKSHAIVLYCRSGHRAGLAKDKLLRAGYRQVTNLGGLYDWPSDCAANMP